jgi:predicted TIM-barrel fold metal-dependent hydrolase
MTENRLPILDCHQHFYDSRELKYPVFQQRSAGFESLVGDYSALPRAYLPEDYRRDIGEAAVAGTIWLEFISEDPLAEARWAENLAETERLPSGMVVSADFSSPSLQKALDEYSAMPHIRCVRQHLGWHPTNSQLRFAQSPDLLTNENWHLGLQQLRKFGLVCELEIFAPQLRDFASVAGKHPDLQFVLPLMGWPLDISDEGRSQWKRDLSLAAANPNVAVKIFGLECIFGIDWTLPQVRPWILDAIDMFGPSRSMFASHLPICKLSCSFQELYQRYLEIIHDFTIAEKRELFHDSAVSVYRLK